MGIDFVLRAIYVFICNTSQSDLVDATYSILSSVNPLCPTRVIISHGKKP